MGSKAHNRKGPGFFGITARTMMGIVAALLVLSYLSVLVNPADLWFMTIFGILFVPLFFLNLLLLVWAVARRSSSFLIPLLALLPSVFFIGNYYQARGADETVAGTSEVKIVSYNVGRFSQYSSLKADSRESCTDSVFRFLNDCDADIICLQEFYTADADRLKSYLRKNFKGYESEYYVYITGRGAYGNVTLSRFPVVGKEKFDFEHSSNLALYTDLKVGNRKIRVYNCHFESYNLSIPRLITSIGKDEEFVHEAEEKMRNSIKRRPQQVDMVLRDISESPLETIVVGDFNDTPMSYTYNKLKKGHKDSFVEAGKGFGGTYINFRPLLRIDYILFPLGSEALSHSVPDVQFSDHYPVVAEITI